MKDSNTLLSFEREVDITALLSHETRLYNHFLVNYDLIGNNIHNVLLMFFVPCAYISCVTYFMSKYLTIILQSFKYQSIALSTIL